MKEREPKHPAYCQECGRIVDISLVQEVRCPQCHKKFTFRAFKEMGDLPISLNIVAIIIVMIVGEWGKAIEDGLIPLLVEKSQVGSNQFSFGNGVFDCFCCESDCEIDFDFCLPEKSNGNEIEGKTRIGLIRNILYYV